MWTGRRSLTWSRPLLIARCLSLGLSLSLNLSLNLNNIRLNQSLILTHSLTKDPDLALLLNVLKQPLAPLGGNHKRNRHRFNRAQEKLLTSQVLLQEHLRSSQCKQLKPTSTLLSQKDPQRPRHQHPLELSCAGKTRQLLQDFLALLSFKTLLLQR